MRKSSLSAAAINDMLIAGFGVAEIARIAGVSKKTIYARLHAAKVKSECAILCDAVKAEQPRACLCCGMTFQSQGPHNRLCNACRARSRDLSPYMPDT